MKKARVSKILTLILAMALVFACFSSSTYALSKQQFGAWMAAALQALNITVTSTNYIAEGSYLDVIEYLNGPYYISNSAIEYAAYQYDKEAVESYLDRSVIQIDKDKVTIDGVDYTDVWLSNDAAEKFRVNAFDIENAFDIASQTEGTFVSGAGTFDEIPVFFSNNQYFTQSHQIPAQVGSATWTTVHFSDGYKAYMQGYGSNQYVGPFFNSSNISLQWYSNNPTSWFVPKLNGVITDPPRITGRYIEEPFDFDWVAGTIPADETLANDEGLRIRVPTEDIADWYTDYPGTADSTVIDMGDPDLEAKVEDLIDLIIPLIPVLDIDFTTNETPTPEPDPDPDPDPEPWDDILSGLRNIFDIITIGNTISQGIKTVADSIASKLDDIKTGIGELANKIETGSADWFRDIVQSIWQPFLPFFNIFRAGVGIWHYVVEWLQYIHEPFLTFWNFLGSAGYIFLTPIYASAAAAIVIAIYRRFGR